MGLSGEIEEELEVLQAVFCQDGEFVLHQKSAESGTACFTINSQIRNDGRSSATNTSISIQFTISARYPRCLPDVSIAAESLSRKATSILKNNLRQYANEVLIGEPMIMQLVEWMQQHAHEYAEVEKVANQSQADCDHKDEVYITLLQLDHMRARTKYVKTLTNWTTELGITGRLLFADKLILILLEGYAENLKEFVVRLRTQKVDVDSSGRSCKERMMTVLADLACRSPSHRYSSFHVMEIANFHGLREEFTTVGLDELFELHVRPLR